MISAKSEKKQTSGVGTKLDILPNKLAGIRNFIEPLTTLLGQAFGITWQDMQVNFKWRKLSEINANHRKKCYLYQEKSQAPTVLANTVFPTSQKNRPHHPQPVDWTDSICDLFPSEIVKLQNPNAFCWPSLIPSS